MTDINGNGVLIAGTKLYTNGFSNPSGAVTRIRLWYRIRRADAETFLQLLSSQREE